MISPVNNFIKKHNLENLKDMAAAHFWPHSRQAGDLSDDTGITLVGDANGVWVEDLKGVKWFDTIAGMWLKNIGHGRNEIAEAVYKQMTQVSYSPGGTVSPATVELSGKLASLTPDKDSRIYFVSGGSEAVETALKMAKKYHSNNGQSRWKVISRRGSYHGATHACISLGGGGVGAPGDYGPLMPGNIHVSNVDNYRDIYQDPIECAYDIERAILHEGPESVAAVIGEPISAANGIHVPDPRYWPLVREICDKYGVLLICDEVITGFGRTGKMFAVEHWGITPDIMTVAKGLTSGYIPIGATIASKKVADAFIGDDDKTFRSLITFGGNPVACAAAITNLDIMINEGMVENSRVMGDYLYEKLQTLRKHEIVGDIRGGLGLLCAIELVKDKSTKEKFSKEDELAKKGAVLMREHALLGRVGDVIPMSPPLCITSDEIDEFIGRMDLILGKLSNQLG